MKNILITMSMMAFLTPAHAEKVYDSAKDYWEIKGFSDPSDQSCVITSNWDDGYSKLNVNVFPNDDGLYTTLTMKHSGWYLDELDDRYEGKFLFRYYSGRDDWSQNAHGQVYNSKTLILRDLTSAFFDGFTHANELVMFPNTDREVVMTLKGTAYVMSALDECLMILEEIK